MNPIVKSALSTKSDVWDFYKSLQELADTSTVAVGVGTSVSSGGEDKVNTLIVPKRIHQKGFKLSKQGYKDLWHKQEGKCAICSAETKLVVDHCHTTGKVRGLLCSKCNLGIGLLGDSLGQVKAAVAYLGNERQDLQSDLELLIRGLFNGR